jgi:hypothetical protein
MAARTATGSFATGISEGNIEPTGVEVGMVDDGLATGVIEGFA